MQSVLITWHLQRYAPPPKPTPRSHAQAGRVRFPYFWACWSTVVARRKTASISRS